jgi:hypothetical protein
MAPEDESNNTDGQLLHLNNILIIISLWKNSNYIIKVAWNIYELWAAS